MLERIETIQGVGFCKSEDLLIGHNGFANDGYWVYDKRRCDGFSTKGNEE